MFGAIGNAVFFLLACIITCVTSFSKDMSFSLFRIESRFLLVVAIIYFVFMIIASILQVMKSNYTDLDYKKKREGAIAYVTFSMIFAVIIIVIPLLSKFVIMDFIYGLIPAALLALVNVPIILDIRKNIEILKPQQEELTEEEKILHAE